MAILRWLREHVSDCVFHCRNEVADRRGDIGGARDKAIGVVAGVADLVGIVEAGPYAGRMFAVEVKRPGWTSDEVRPTQRLFGRRMAMRGGFFVIAGTVAEVEAWARAEGIARPAGWRAPWAIEREEYAL